MLAAVIAAVGVVLVAQDVSTIGGPAGWVGAGLLGLVLSWVFLVHLPNVQRQLREILDLHSKERETDRMARHEVANMFQRAIAETTAQYADTIKQIEVQHRQDAIADREAFMQRNKAVEEAIDRQTKEIRIEMREAVRSSCRWFAHLDELAGNKTATKPPHSKQ